MNAILTMFCIWILGAATGAAVAWAASGPVATPPFTKVIAVGYDRPLLLEHQDGSREIIFRLNGKLMEFQVKGD